MLSASGRIPRCRAAAQGSPGQEAGWGSHGGIIPHLGDISFPGASAIGVRVMVCGHRGDDQHNARVYDVGPVRMNEVSFVGRPFDGER